MLFSIKSKNNDFILFKLETTSMKLCVEAAIKSNINLSNANFSNADLSFADLHLTDLSNANFSNTNLRFADFRDADLSNADCNNADFSSADLRFADLNNANFSNANLRSANIRFANLSNADLSNADCNNADFSSADLRFADLLFANLSNANFSNTNLRFADLRFADLNYTDLRSSDLRFANLSDIRDDLFAVLSSAPKEVEGLILAIKEGRIEGSTYNGQCACLIGTIANIRGCEHNQLGILQPDSNRPIEIFLMGIKKGDTPENNQVSKLALQWSELWLSNMKSEFLEINK